MARSDVIDILTSEDMENTPYGPGCNFVWILSVVFLIGHKADSCFTLWYPWSIVSCRPKPTGIACACCKTATGRRPTGHEYRNGFHFSFDSKTLQAHSVDFWANLQSGPLLFLGGRTEKKDLGQSTNIHHCKTGVVLTSSSFFCK